MRKLYRVLRPLSTGEEVGCLVWSGKFSDYVLGKLIENDALAEVSSPPLGEIPGWKARSEILEKENIVTISDFLGAEDEALQELFNYKTTRMITKWKLELGEWLTAPNKKKTG